MEKTVLGEINRLRQLNVAELREQWRELYGEESRSRNREFLYRRLAWRIQELHHGGLSRTARDRIDELAPDSFFRARNTQPPPDAPERAETARRPQRDPRLPASRTDRRFQGCSD